MSFTSEDLSCFYAAFRADDVPMDIVPSFDLSSRIKLLSHTAVGPFKAGISTAVPLWFALTLRQRSLCTISLPDWLTAENLVEIIAYEKREGSLFSDQSRLPAAYFEIAKRLLTAGTDTVDKSVSLLVQDLLSVRLDKLRQQFQTLFSDVASDRTDLFVTVNGIGTQELAILHRFVRQALNDQNYLLVGQGAANDSTGTAEGEGNNNAMGRVGEKLKKPAVAGAAAAGEDAQSLPAVRARVPLRRFRK
jgi:hypothetical protein